ncbi:hypothetical protein A6R68_11847, partial [Neotoma lepida]
CSYIPKCGNNFEESMSLVSVVMENFRRHQHFPCYSDPEGNQKSVILTKLYSSNVLFHSLFWPTCMMAGGVAIVAMNSNAHQVSLKQFLGDTAPPLLFTCFIIISKESGMLEFLATPQL